MNYTPSQVEAITADRPEVLVSAAAGSGKTRVVTERVELLVRGADMEAFRSDQRKTTVAANMEDIRHMLLVTFTRAAASEMRTRIVAALSDAARSEPDPEAAERLREQAELAAGADITTLHGFCRRVIAEHYEAAGVAAGFSLLNESQASYLRGVCAREVFDELYEQRDEDAQRLLARYGSSGDDQELLALVVSLHAQMMGNVDPWGWLGRSLKEEGELDGYLDELYALQRETAGRRLQDLHAVLTRMLALESSGAMAACKTPEKDRQGLLEVEEWQKTLHAGGTPMLPAKGFLTVRSGESGDMKPTEKLRKKARDILKAARTLLEPPDRDADRADLMHTQQDVRVLADIVRAFDEKYTARKEAANRLDFADLEHRALRVLRQFGPEYAEKYRHVFVDEYQDTNPVQEAILAAIHLGPQGEPRNRQFLVGDMKQSIYGFRFADPTIFDGKSKTYGRPETAERSQLIRMNDNFRSCSAVVTGVNAVMGELMNEDLGDVAYTEAEQLVCGRGGEGACRILLAERQPGGDEDAEPAEGALAEEAELIAGQIEALHALGRDYGDIAILFRRRDDRVGRLTRALEARGIPAAVPGGTTLYVEIEIFLNLLRLVVNDRQDVPLLSVLRSYMFGFDEQELAWIAEWEGSAEVEAADAPNRVRQLAVPADEPREPFFQRLERFQAEAAAAVVAAGDQELHARVQAKVERFYRELRSLRAEGADMSLDRFAESAADRFSLPSHLLTRPNGAARRRMYDQLLEVLRELKQLHGNSLLRVLDAVDALRERGELFSMGDKAALLPGMVKLMTVHGSKGLEFPVVFLAGLDQQFRKPGSQGGAVRSDRFGLTLRYAEPRDRERRDTLETRMVKDYLRRQQRSEELRLLYVAMTRAREELYLCGLSKDPSTDMLRWEQVRENKDVADSPLDWIMGAWLALDGQGREAAAMLRPPGSGAAGTAEHAAAPTFDWQAFTRSLQGRSGGAGLLPGLPERVRIAAQQGVSKLTEKDFQQSELASGRPRSIRPVTETEISGAHRGTLLHRFMRYAVGRGLSAAAALAAMRENCLVSAAESEELEASLGQMQAFLDSDLYERVRRSPKVLTEQRFRLLVDASELDANAPAAAGKVRLRGMIDLAFLEDGAWVLVDYKTDRSDDLNLLVERYRGQLGLYSRALREITGLPVRECHLYLFTWGHSVPVGPEQIS